jgi:hypothetical protein
MILLEAVLMGICATFVMDLLARLLAKRGIIHPLIGPEVIGRWSLSMLRGKFVHRDIHETPPFPNERFWALVSHYLIGMALAAVYLVLVSRMAIAGDRVWAPLAFGVATSVLPWFWLYPSIGIGVMASKSPDRARLIRTSLVNHASFGVGLMLWGLLFHGFFV